jgi:hypothetical protein
MWEFPDVEAMNPPGQGQRSSPLQHLLGIGASSPALFCEAAELLEDIEPPTILCFSQLPYALSLEPRWYTLKGWSDWIKMEARFTSGTIGVRADGKLEVQYEPQIAQDGTTEQTGFAITQVLVKIPLWGPRLRRFNRYAEHVTPDGLRDGIVWPADQNTGHAMNAADFEYALARRVMPELHAGLSSFLRHQAGRNPALQISVPDKLLAFFIMPFPGRITYAHLPIPTLSVVAERMRKPLGLTLTFDTRLHRFMPMAFDVFIAEVLGPDADVTIEERSAPSTVGGSFIRLRGSNAKDLIAVAEAFYDRAWLAEAAASEQQLAHTMSRGVAVILEQLQSMRDYWSGLAVANPDVQEMLTDQATAHVRQKDRELLTTPTQRIANALAKDLKTRVGKELTSAAEGFVRGALPSED